MPLGTGPATSGRMFLWATNKIRKPRRCARCRIEIKKGEEAFSPITNTHERGERMHPSCAALVLDIRE